MSIFERLFPKSETNESAPDTIQSGDGLVRLAESNTVVAAELTSFTDRVDEIKQQAEIGGGMTPADWNLVHQAAVRSAEALSGYGISVTPEGFEECV